MISEAVLNDTCVVLLALVKLKSYNILLLKYNIVIVDKVYDSNTWQFLTYRRKNNTNPFHSS